MHITLTKCIQKCTAIDKDLSTAVNDAWFKNFLILETCHQISQTALFPYKSYISIPKFT